MICFLGSSHAAIHLRDAANIRGASLTDNPDDADVIFVSEDTETDWDGVRDLTKIRELIKEASKYQAQIVLTSQVPPGFTRSLGMINIYHQAETLRIKDAEHRALNPEYIAVGGPEGICREYANYLISFQCPILRMTWEDAEFSKIAVNMFLAAQVETTNRLSKAASKIGAKWEEVSRALKYDSRIGKEAYLNPGNWKSSRHLLRDSVTLSEIESA